MDQSQHKLVFNFNLIINELTHIPLLHGVLFLHWKVNRLEGYSPHFPIRDHEIHYRMSFQLTLEIGLLPTNVLEDVILKIYVNQETKGGQEFVRFGMVTLNLSEFAGQRESTRKFLLEQSKTNAALSITVFSVLKSGGAPTFKTPDPSKKFVRLDDEESSPEDADALRSHAVQEELLISDQRFMVRERENMRLPSNVVESREPAADVVEAVLSRTLSGII